LESIRFAQTVRGEPYPKNILRQIIAWKIAAKATPLDGTGI
jgi:hypothetical protein